MSFRPIFWDSAFTGRGRKSFICLVSDDVKYANGSVVLWRKKRNLERPGLVGPMGETLVMDMDPQDRWQVLHTCNQRKLPQKARRTPKNPFKRTKKQ